MGDNLQSIHIASKGTQAMLIGNMEIESCVSSSAAKPHVRKSKIGSHTKPWSMPEHCATIKRRNNLRRKATKYRTGYLETSTKVRKLTVEVPQSKWEDFLADLVHNFDPTHTWRNIKAMSRFSASMAFSELLVHNGLTFIANQGKADDFMIVYAAIN